MENSQSTKIINFEKCHTNGCSIDASNICMNGRIIICNTCTAILHYDCNLKIKDEEGFVINSVELLKNLVQIINTEEFVCSVNTFINILSK